MKTDVKQLLKDIKARDLEFREPADAKLLNKEKEYHIHDTYMVGPAKSEYAYPCLVELFGDGKVISLKRINEIEQNTVRVDKEAYLRESGAKPMFVPTPQVIDPTHVLTPVQTTSTATKVDTTVVSDASAKAIIGDFLEKNQ